MQAISRILIVDDEEVNLKILRWILEEEGIQVVEAVSGEDALSILEEDMQFDTILLDRMMEKMDGMEVLARLKQHEMLGAIPIIMQSASATNEQKQEGMDAGVAYYLSKPFEKEDILEALQYISSLLQSNAINQPV